MGTRRRAPFRSSLAFGCALAALGALPRPACAQDQAGLNTHVPSNDLLDLCVNLGVTWIRIDANWFEMNPARGRYVWTEIDRVVDGARSRGLRVFMTLAYTPAWVDRVARTRTDTATLNDEPATSAEWSAFVTEAVRRYRPRGVTHYGMWNEPNLDQFWESAAGVDPYVDKILVPGAAAVRANCTDCTVLAPDLAHLGGYDTFLSRVLTRAASSIDILAHHIYQGWPETGSTGVTADNFLQALERARFPGLTRAALREVLDARGFTRPVWITETGYRARIGDAADEDRQAVFARRTLEEQWNRPWWSNTFFYEIMDCGVDDPACTIDGFGIARPLRANTTGPRSFPTDYRLKPAFNAIRDFLRARAMSDAGVPVDASAPRDVPVVMDVRVTTDTGAVSDVVVARDTGAVIDTGAVTDVALVRDAPMARDVTGLTDAGASATDEGLMEAPAEPPGCACHAEKPVRPRWMSLAALAVLMTMGARRGRQTTRRPPKNRA